MNIDWFTFMAQIVNFLILLALLKYFLYDRIVKVMDERENKIKARLEEAQSKQDEAENEFKRYQKKNQEIQNERETLLNEAKQAVAEQRQQLIQQAQQEVDSLQLRWKQSVEREQNEFLKQLRRKVGNQVYAISKRVLKDISNQDLEERIISLFIERIQQLNENELTDIQQTLQNTDKKITINSAFKIADDVQQKIREALQQQLPEAEDLHFQVNRELIGGIEMRLNGKAIKWSIRDYLSTLQEQFGKLIAQQTPEHPEKIEGEK